MTRLQLNGKQLKELREQIFDRSMGLCDYCGTGVKPDEWHLHHRQLRSGQGADTPANCIVVHPACHHQIHAHPKESSIQGFIVSRYADPASTPMKRGSAAMTGRGEWVQP